MNKAMVIGNLTKDPELRTTASGISVCTFTVAVSRPFNKDETDFIPIVTWRRLADNCGKFLAKGRKVAVAGRIQTRSYEDNGGTRRYVTEIVADDVEFLTPKGDSNAPRNEPPPPGNEVGLFGDEPGDFEPLDDEQMPF